MATRRRGARAFAQFAARPKLVISERESIDRIDGGLRIDGGRNKTSTAIGTDFAGPVPTKVPSAALNSIPFTSALCKVYRLGGSTFCVRGCSRRTGSTFSFHSCS
jgi:hypothetical protein